MVDNLRELPIVDGLVLAVLNPGSRRFAVPFFLKLAEQITQSTRKSAPESAAKQTSKATEPTTAATREGAQQVAQSAVGRWLLTGLTSLRRTADTLEKFPDLVTVLITCDRKYAQEGLQCIACHSILLR
ncbi:hypothetical protein ASG25_20665 [Rhizobium sp. Leaf384]|nr:hypothetical protein ASG25_20665 [Rhizobium sp. Leaf384]